MLTAIIIIGIFFFVVLIWIGMSAPSAKEIDQIIKENERLLADSHSRRDDLRHRVHGREIDTIKFRYVDATGQPSKRRVVVRSVSDDHFKGLDTDIRKTRTFRLDRVDGGILSEQTGEVLDPIEWAAGILKA